MEEKQTVNYKVFISGHRDLTQDEFDTIYKPAIDKYVDWLNEDHSYIFNKKELTFYVGDCDGCDNMAIEYIANNIMSNNQNVYLVFCTCNFNFDGKHIYQFNNPNISVVNGFNSHEERDTYMTLNTESDILWVRPGKWDSGTAQNFVKRIWLPKNN